MSHLPIWRFLVLFSTHKYKFGAEFRGGGLLVDLQVLSKGILKIVNFMWCGSPLNALLSAYIL